MYTFLLYNFYDAYLEIFRLKIYFENCVKSKWEKHLKTNRVGDKYEVTTNPCPSSTRQPFSIHVVSYLI